MTFNITVTGTYTRDEIPPRCRKPRPVSHDTSAKATIPTVTATDAPVAFRVTNHNRAVSEIRTHAGRLYGPYLPARQQTDPTEPGSAQFPAEIDENDHTQTRYRLGSPSTAEEFTAAVTEYFARFLIIDNAVWVEVPEPGYHVATYGLGGINGSTGLSVSTRKDHGTLFRADEFEAALTHAIETSRDRGDDPTRYEQHGEDYRDIEVLIPEAVTLVTIPPTPKPVRRLRWDYDSARSRLRDAHTPDEETQAFQEVERLRQEIIQTGHTPVESDARPYEARHGKLSDPRYTPGVSEHDDDMTDAEWMSAMGEPSGALLTHRSFDVVYYPDSEEPPFTGNIVVDTQDVSLVAKGQLTEYLIEQGMAHEWRYADGGAETFEPSKAG